MRECKKHGNEFWLVATRHLGIKFFIHSKPISCFAAVALALTRTRNVISLVWHFCTFGNFLSQMVAPIWTVWSGACVLFSIVTILVRKKTMLHQTRVLSLFLRMRSPLSGTFHDIGNPGPCFLKIGKIVGAGDFAGIWSSWVVYKDCPAPIRPFFEPP